MSFFFKKRKSDEATSEEFIWSSPLICTLITLEEMAVYHGWILAPQRQTLNTLHVCSISQIRCIYEVINCTKNLHQARQQKTPRAATSCATLYSKLSTEEQLILPTSMGTPSELVDTLRGGQEHLGWMTYKVSLGTRPGSTKSTWAGNVLEPWNWGCTCKDTRAQNYWLNMGQTTHRDNFGELITTLWRI
jgi:hypothetical protein